MFSKKKIFILTFVITLICFVTLLVLNLSRVKNFFLPNTKNDDKAIIIVPGIGCSTLHYLGKTNNMYKHGECVFFRGDFNTWDFLDLKDCAIKALSNYKLLYCDENGKPSNEYIGLLTDYTDVDEYDIKLSKYGFSFMFEKIIKYFEQKYGEKTKHRYKVYLFNYDWRISNEDNGRRLYEEIKKYDGGVIIIGFSMGNLVFSKAATLLYKDNKLDKIKAFISTFAPYNGSVDAISFLKTGILEYPLFIFLNKLFKLDTITRVLGRNYPAMYELIPNKTFFKRKKGFLYDTDNCRLNYVQSILYLKNDKNINKSLLNNAVAFHDSLYINNKYILDFIKNKVFFIGVGYKTPDSLLIDRKHIGSVKVLSNSDGDGTVNNKYGAYPQCDIDEDEIIYIKSRHNELFSNAKFLIDLSNIVDLYV